MGEVGQVIISSLKPASTLNTVEPGNFGGASLPPFVLGYLNLGMQMGSSLIC